MKKSSIIKTFLYTVCMLLVLSIIPFFSFSEATASDNAKKSSNYRNIISTTKVKKGLRKAIEEKENKRAKRCSNRWYVPGDYDGDRRYEKTYWKNANGVWSIYRYKNMPVKNVQFGLPGDYPFCYDVDSDGADEIIVYRPSTDACHISLYNESWPTSGERIVYNCSK